MASLEIRRWQKDLDCSIVKSMIYARNWQDTRIIRDVYGLKIELLSPWKSYVRLVFKDDMQAKVSSYYYLGLHVCNWLEKWSTYSSTLEFHKKDFPKIWMDAHKSRYIFNNRKGELSMLVPTYTSNLSWHKIDSKVIFYHNSDKMTHKGEQCLGTWKHISNIKEGERTHLQLSKL